MNGDQGTDLLDAVAAIWADALRVDAVAPDGDFLLLGGHSLAAIEVTSRVRELTGTDIPLDLLFHHLVLREFVEAVAGYSE